MSTSSHTQPSIDLTGDRDVAPGADDLPTPDEEKAADRAAETAPDVSEPYTELNRTGANAEGEGRIED